MSRLSPEAGIAVEWICLAVALIFVILRVYVRAFLQRIFRPGDIVIILAWFLFLIGNICDTLSYANGLWQAGIVFTGDTPPNLEDHFPDKKQLVFILKVLYASAIPYYACLWCVKLAFLALYCQIIPRTLVKLRWALLFTTVFVFIGFVCMLALNLFWCMPVSKNWALQQKDSCYAYASLPPYFVTLGFHLISDFLIYGLPFFLFPVLKQINGNSKRDLAGLAFVFSLGGFCIACTVARTAANGLEAWLPTIGAWSAAEMCVAVVVACCPPLKLLWLGYSVYGIRRGSLANVGDEVEYGRCEEDVLEIVTNGKRTMRASQYPVNEKVKTGCVHVEEGGAVELVRTRSNTGAHTLDVDGRVGSRGRALSSAADSHTTGDWTVADDYVVASGGLSVATAMRK